MPICLWMPALIRMKKGLPVDFPARPSSPCMARPRCRSRQLEGVFSMATARCKHPQPWKACHALLFEQSIWVFQAGPLYPPLPCVCCRVLLIGQRPVKMNENEGIGTSCAGDAVKLLRRSCFHGNVLILSQSASLPSVGLMQLDASLVPGLGRVRIRELRACK